MGIGAAVAAGVHCLYDRLAEFGVGPAWIYAAAAPIAADNIAQVLAPPSIAAAVDYVAPVLAAVLAAGYIIGDLIQCCYGAEEGEGAAEAEAEEQAANTN